MTVKEILIEARKIISDEKNWTQGTYSRDENGREVSIWDQSAVCFCSIGAVRRAVMKSTYKKSNALQLIKDVINVLSLELKIYSRLSDFNDNSTHQEVLALFDKAIANCQ